MQGTMDQVYQAHPESQMAGTPCDGVARSARRLARGAGLLLSLFVLVAGLPSVRAQGADPASPEARYLKAHESLSLADWLKDKGDMQEEAAEMYAEALRLFEQLADEEPEWQPKVVAFRIAYCRNALQPPEEADPEAADPEAADAPPQSPLTRGLETGAHQERAGDSAGALAVYRELLAQFPRQPDAVLGACRCLLRLGRRDEARTLIREALSLPDPDVSTLALAALIECAGGNWTEAVALANRALAKNRFTSAAHLALGVAQAAAGRLDEAVESTKRALVGNPKLGDAYYNLARICLLQKPRDLDTVRVHYQNALRHGARPDPQLDRLLAE